jgi:hypothetical protein
LIKEVINLLISVTNHDTINAEPPNARLLRYTVEKLAAWALFSPALIAATMVELTPGTCSKVVVVFASWPRSAAELELGSPALSANSRTFLRRLVFNLPS